MAITHRWKHTAVTAAILLAAGGWHWSEAQALTLGPIRVESHLGEPLRATIPVTNLNANEAQSLRANPASPDVFNAHGANYSPVMTRLRVTLQQLDDGTALLQLTTNEPVNEPFLDLVLNTSWDGGNVVRSYALLLDPPASGAVAPVAPARVEPTSVQAPVAPPAATAAAAAAAPARVTTPVVSTDVYQRATEWLRRQGQAVAPSAPTPAARPAAGSVSEGQVTTAAPAPAAPASQSVTTQRGDTAGAIARRHLPANVSLDQMLVALQRANPNAFIQGNVNLLRAGVTLTIPDAAAAQRISAQEARQLVAAQTRDFREYRARVAQAAPPAAVPAQPSDTASGVVTAPPVTPPASTGDALVLSSQQAEQARLAEEARIAAEKQAAEDAERKREAEANIARMEALLKEASQETAQEGETASVGSDSGGLIPVPGESPLPAAATQPVAPDDAATGQASDATPSEDNAAAATDTVIASGAQDAAAQAEEPAAPADPLADTSAAPAVAAVEETASTPAPQPAAPAEPAPAPAAPPPPAPAPPEPSPISFLADNPNLPLAGGALAILLLGYGYYRYRKRRGEAEVVYENSGNIPDSFFEEEGASDKEPAKSESPSTRGSSTGMSTGVSSMSYSPSQIDATGEGDPVLEADVLLAYGRDQQAEEVLKEAELHNPTRVAIKVRLAEIYASRQDKLAFEAKAQEIARMTEQSGPEWIKVAEIGRNLDPSNALYRKVAGAAGAGAAAAVAGATGPDSGGDASILSGFGPLSGLDFDFQPSSQPATEADTGQNSQSAVNSASAPLTDLGLDLDLGEIESRRAGLPSAQPSAPTDRAGLPSASSALDFEPAAQEDLATSFQTAGSEQLDASTSRAGLDDAAPAQDDGLFGAPSSLPTDLSPSLPSEPDTPTRALELDLSNLDLEDFASPSTVAHGTQSDAGSTIAGLSLHDSASEDPLSTKLALAKEFLALGDKEGARALAQEVLKQADGPLKASAQSLIDALG
ncbi:hypothetical protein AAV94_11425 [Lampropedia cohaerens]|uniref:LysM domain-containing protein n=1 Tax=Lampropedia cohaerens TaxID=1610491 RepID=A0A0U1PY32_9BURK|nr:FimV/HubP family polar landmark protein [Lampropedia cohaerens]KKW67429.1 hypothetical protein AAV94_11425 [Lampropedia cohaerens]